MQPRLAMIVLVLVSSAVPFCAQADDDSELARLRAEITMLVGAARCANLVNCRVAALGVTACGAAQYIAYSWRSTDADALQTKIAEYNLVYEDVHTRAQSGASACSAREAPAAACVNGRCVLPDQ